MVPISGQFIGLFLSYQRYNTMCHLLCMHLSTVGSYHCCHGNPQFDAATPEIDALVSINLTSVDIP